MLYLLLHSIIILFILLFLVLYYSLNLRSLSFHHGFTVKLKLLLSKKENRMSTYRSTRNLLNYSIFSLMSACCKFMSKKCYKSYIKCIETSFSTNPKFFWNLWVEIKKLITYHMLLNYYVWAIDGCHLLQIHQ